MSLSRNELAKKIYQVAHLTGEFKLRSGKISNEYFDKYRFETQPELLANIAAQMSELVPENIDALAGLEMGGIPVSTALSLHTKLPSIYVRKEAKEYGTCRVAEGFETLKQKKLCIVEDVVTTGGQILLSVEDLRKEGAIVDTVVCVICREAVAFEKLKEKGLTLKPLFTMEELKTQA